MIVIDIIDDIICRLLISFSYYNLYTYRLYVFIYIYTHICMCIYIYAGLPLSRESPSTVPFSSMSRLVQYGLQKAKAKVPFPQFFSTMAEIGNQSQNREGRQDDDDVYSTHPSSSSSSNFCLSTNVIWYN